MTLRDRYLRAALAGFYRRLVLRQPKSHETPRASAARRALGAAWDRVFYRPFEPDGGEFDLVFVVPHSSKGWILDAICREIIQHYSGRATIVYEHRNLPRAPAYFFAHYMQLKDALLYSPYLLRKKVLVYYTHPRDVGLQKSDVSYWLNQASHVIPMCSAFRDQLAADGVSPSRLVLGIGAADPDFFPGHERSESGAVGFCTAYYERKDPDRILNIVKSMPHRRFILLGRNWQEYPRFEELKALPNFEYREAKYKDYPAFYAELSVFVSASQLEGGPIPLIESMMANVLPVASDTGFARDVIEHGRNGYIFPVDESTGAICRLIDQAYDNPTGVRSTAVQYSWKNLSQLVQSLV